MNIRNFPMKLLLSHVDTKSQLTEFLGKRLLKHFSGSNEGLVVVYGSSAYSNDNIISQNMSTHNHEEADTQIPLHVIDAARQGTSTRDMYVWSPDTDVFLLLIYLVANHTIPGQLKMLTGRAKFFRTIDIKERCTAIGTEKSKALIGLHNFTGADWGGKFFSISKKAWITKFLQLPSSSKIIKTFQIFGCSDSLPEADVVNVETFVCSVYSSKSLCMMTSTRERALWLIGHLECEITRARLPSKGQVLRKFYFHHGIEKKTKPVAAKEVIEAVLLIWGRAGIPTSALRTAKEKLLSLVAKYESLQKHQKRASETARMKEEMFKGDLEDLFDVASSDALDRMTVEEDK
ncbi:hypothetical protein GWK47_019398 [Chionoecetes opilio]|uniref:Uncharacterized protein n=1 Tax=Chionoecetes opilio TaxID=41210 RepID=A0A8J5CIW5_CHIOP|nr:hypothetical protein GWK47_019398 [Chionoecetes opilio]